MASIGVPMPSGSPLGSPSASRFSLFGGTRRPRSGSNRERPQSPETGEDTASMRRPASFARNRSVSTPIEDAFPETSRSPFGFRRRGTESASLPSTPVNELQQDPLGSLSIDDAEASSRMPIPLETAAVVPSSTFTTANNVAAQILRLVPHLESSSRSLHFDPVTRNLRVNEAPVRIGRFNERGSGTNDALRHRIAFKSKVVSRSHAEISIVEDGRVVIKDTKSSSGTFLNHIRLSGPGAESRAFTLRDGDVLQLGVDYQGGTETMYRCVKMRVELNRPWQRGASTYNINTFRSMLGNSNTSPLIRSRSEAEAGSMLPAVTAVPSSRPPKVRSQADESSTTCCICLFSVMVCQALFIAPCSHVYHYKCILPLLRMHHPGFSCPLCRTFANLDADVELEEAWEPDVDVDSGPESADENSQAGRAPDKDDPARMTSHGMSADGHTNHTGIIRRPSVASSLLSRPYVDASSDFVSDEFDDQRRSSIAISGPSGMSAPFPVTGRSSRPSSLRKFEMSTGLSVSKTH